MSKDIPVTRRSPHCFKGSKYAKYRVFIENYQIEYLYMNPSFINNFIHTNYHEPIEGYQEFSYFYKGSISRFEFALLLSSMNITNYIIPKQHINNKLWNL
jgi:hypothetical protein